MARKTNKTPTLVAEICLYGNRQTGAGWLARGEHTGILGDGEPKAGRSFTEASWQAADALRAAGLRGAVAIYEPHGEFVAVADLGLAWTYGSLEWRPAGHGCVITPEQLEALEAVTGGSR